MEHGRGSGPKTRHTNVRAHPAFGHFPVHEGFVSHLRDQDRKQADLGAGFDVGRSVAYDRARGKVDSPIVGRLKEQRGTGFPALALLVGGVGAVVERIDTGPKGPEPLIDAGVDPVDCLLGEQSATDAGLVCYADDEVVVLTKEAESVSHPVRQFRRLRVGEVVKVGHERPVAVDEDRPPAPPMGMHALGHGRVGPVGLITLDPGGVRDVLRGMIDLTVQKLAGEWLRAVSHVVARSPRVTVLYSGGLDSSLVAFSARELTQVGLVTVGVPGCHDLRAAEEGARLLRLPWTFWEVGPADVGRVVARDSEEVGRSRAASRPVLVGMALALDAAPDPRVLCGQGADELFLGYAHFRGLTGEVLEAQRTSDLDRLVQEDWPLSRSVARRRGKRLESPFLDAPFLDLLRSIPAPELSLGEGRKPVLRRLAQAVGLPSELARQPKKAFQYGSGLERLWRSVGRGHPWTGSIGEDSRAGLVPDRPA